MPNQFLSHNTLLQSKNQAKVAYFTKLMILIFGCPEEIRITNFTRMPLLLYLMNLIIPTTGQHIEKGITAIHLQIQDHVSLDHNYCHAEAEQDING